MFGTSSDRQFWALHKFPQKRLKLGPCKAQVMARKSLLLAASRG